MTASHGRFSTAFALLTQTIGAAVCLAMSASAVTAQDKILIGRATDSITALPITSGQVAVLGTRQKVGINRDGSFVITAPFREIVLEIRVEGYRRTEVVVARDQDDVKVRLPRDFFGAEGSVATGQGLSVERRMLANGIQMVKGEDINRAQAGNVHEALSGKVTGAVISGSSSAPGSAIQMRLRGVTSLLGAGEPLFVVDGVVLSGFASSIPLGPSPNVRGTFGTTRALSMSPIAYLNPNDIESIEILKGASAGAMYGSQASNGVVLITTKHGRRR